MDLYFNTLQYLSQYLESKAHSLDEFNQDFTADLRIAEPRFGDFQANGILPYAKKNKLNPRPLAEKLIASLKLDPSLIEVSLAGPGFINFKLSPPFFISWLSQYKSEDTFHHASENVYKNKTISIDYSSPNTAKQMHVGHLRSMVIGEAIQRLLRFCGAKIIRDNHIGDWGTQFGILIYAIKKYSFNLDSPHEDILSDLETIYRKGNTDFEASDETKEIARAELVKLQQGDPQNVALWKKIVSVSYAAFQEIYDIMNVHFDVVQGESFYKDQVDNVCNELHALGIAQESEGALIVFHPNPNPKVKDYPYIIRKKDGASNYATTDLATILYHSSKNHVDEMIYVTDGRQQDHFKYTFLTAQKWFKAKNYNLPKLTHVWFGSILGNDGKAIKTRSGDPIKLKALLQEGIDRAYNIVSEKNPSLDEASKKSIAKVVGLGAIRYADLSQNRTSDYVFEWNKILSFDGNTAPYLLYAIARIHSIYRKIQITPGDQEENPSPLETQEELMLARKLVFFPIILDQTITDLRPHILCNYLFELAGLFSSFYNANKIIIEDVAIKSRRLMLCARTLRILETGLHLLGLETLDKM